MLREIYLRDESDLLYDPDALETTSDLEALLGEIKMILFSKNGDVMGSYDFGYNIEENLYTFDLNSTALRNQLIDSIYYRCPDAKKYNVDIQVQFFQGTARDICLIDIYIDNTKTLGVLVK